MMATENVGAVLRDMKTRVAGIATAFVARDGRVISADLPEGVYAETFAIMSATILGAAAAASAELGRTGPGRIVIEGLDTTTVVIGSGEHSLLVAVADSSADPEKLLAEVAKFAGFLTRR